MMDDAKRKGWTWLVLAFLNHKKRRCTFGALAGVLGVPAQSVGQYLGSRRPYASWVVNKKTGYPTGYTLDQLAEGLRDDPYDPIDDSEDLRRHVSKFEDAETTEIIQNVLDQSSGMERAIYRGHGSSEWPLESSAVRRLKAHGYAISLEMVRQYHREILLPRAKIMEGDNRSDEQIVALLQHHGAATMLLDFTESPLVALWFACWDPKWAKKDGKVFAVDIGRSGEWKNGHGARWLTEDVQENVYYHPGYALSPKVTAQRSVLVVCRPNPPEEFKEIAVPSALKPAVCRRLDSLGVSRDFLFPDLFEIAKVNGIDDDLPDPELPLDGPAKLPAPPSAKAVHVRAEYIVGQPAAIKWAGEKAFSQTDFAAARAYFALYVQRHPNIGESHWLLGNALAASKDYEDALNSYNKAIELKDQPMPSPFKAAIYHYNRGNAYAVLNRHNEAVQDYTAALEAISGESSELVHRLRWPIYYNRGNTHYVLQEFEKAVDDFENAQRFWGTPRSDICLNKGNALIMQGKFGKAAEQFGAGAGIMDARSEIDCREPQMLVKHLIEHCGVEVRKDRFDVRNNNITVQVKREKPQPFVFQGNRGNIGNWGGGAGYGGLQNIDIHLESVNNPGNALHRTE